MPATMPRGVPEVFHVMAKPSGAVCNLDCTYCFFLSKELLYPGDRFRMADETLREWIRQTIESHTGPQVTIAFQGGEPTLLGVDFMRRAVAHAKEVARADQDLEFTIQTNGTLLNEEWAEFLRDEQFLVGLSMDGPAPMHDAYRVDKRGGPTYDRVRAAWDLLGSYDVSTNILCTVHAANADNPVEVYRHFRDDLGAEFIQVIPIVERATEDNLDAANEGWGERSVDRPLYMQEGGLVTERTVTAEQWGAFLSGVFDEWVHNDVGSVYIPHFEAAVASWLGINPSMCVFRETCGDALALEHNGDLYSCDHFVEPDYLLGNIHETHVVDLVASPQQVKFGQDKADTLPQYCLDCDVKFACNGECPRNRFILTPDGEPGLNYLCAGFKAFYGHIDEPMKIIAGLLRNGRYADEVMGVLARKAEAEFAGVGRNDPCTCGSGRKFKHCHGASTEP
jgi:uncharacterized protein